MIYLLLVLKLPSDLIFFSTLSPPGLAGEALLDAFPGAALPGPEPILGLLTPLLLPLLPALKAESLILCLAIMFVYLLYKEDTPEGMPQCD